MPSVFGQLVIGPPGSGKTSYCAAMARFLTTFGRKVAVVNLDPANDALAYEAAVDISRLVTLEDVMTNLSLGPNGGLMYCMEFLEKNVDWLLREMASRKDHYFLFDCPGQVELYTHHAAVKNVMERLEKEGFHLCTVHLVDSHYCSEPGKFISTLLMSLSSMLHIALPHVNVLSKVDQMIQHRDKLPFGFDFYTEVLDLSYLLDALNRDPLTGRYAKLNDALVSLVEDYSLVSYVALNVKDRSSLLRVKNAVDKANGYIFGSGEERNIQSLLSCAIGAEYESERVGDVMDNLLNAAPVDEGDNMSDRV